MFHLIRQWRHGLSEFSIWMKDALQKGWRDVLPDYRRQAPHAAKNHPADEHLMPLSAVMGAARRGTKAMHLHSSHEYGILSMDLYQFA